jgi:uncharacterized small protein (DUF1192 family)
VASSSGATAFSFSRHEIESTIILLEEELAKLKAALKQEGEILESKKRGRGRPPKNPAA